MLAQRCFREGWLQEEVAAPCGGAIVPGRLFKHIHMLLWGRNDSRIGLTSGPGALRELLSMAGGPCPVGGGLMTDFSWEEILLPDDV